MLALHCHIVVCVLSYENPHLFNISDEMKVSIMDNYHIAEKDSPAGSTFLGVTLDPAGIPVLFKSLASIIGISNTTTKLCPFCEETLQKEACTCRFCNRILMKQINFKTPKNDCGQVLK
jgi:hypothetical protein